jgi:iron complex outermembrane receptor protein
MLGRYDARSIDNLAVIAGPYSVRNGPGFAFIDMDLANTVRYDCCESHNRLGYVYRGNGQQHYVVDTFWGGNTDYGYIINYAYRNGADYRAGNGARIPSSYLVNNASGQLGWDLGLDSNIEFRYDFVDQKNTQIPGQFFDLDELETHSFLATYTNRDDSAAWTQFRLDGWYNRTPAQGTLRNDPYFQVQDRVESALETRFGQPQGSMTFTGNTNSRLQATGGRAEFEFGDPDDVRLYAGTDVRHLRQVVNEHFIVSGLGPGLDFGINTQLPDSEMFNPGAYAQLDVPLTSYWMTHWGVRGDYVHTMSPGQATHDNGLYAYFVRNDLQLTDNAIGTVSFGHAQRAPTLIERYSRGIFVSVIQNGFTRVLGDDTLGPERLWQIDAALTLDYGNTRANIAGYHSWINNYITYTGALVDDPTGARLLQYTPTQLATLTGFEARVEQDLSSRWMAFGAGHYVYGVDQTLGAPLWGISPIEGQVGLNWHDDSPRDRYAVEGVVRFVNSQRRLGQIAPAVPLGNSFPDERLIPIEDVTPCFTVVNLRGYWNVRQDQYQQLRLIGGVDNLFDATYLQHLDLRLSQPSAFGNAFAYAPGITPYVGIDWTY